MAALTVSKYEGGLKKSSISKLIRLERYSPAEQHENRPYGHELTLITSAIEHLPQYGEQQLCRVRCGRERL